VRHWLGWSASGLVGFSGWNRPTRFGDRCTQVIQYLAQEDISSALDWVGKLSSDDAPPRSMGQVIRIMSQADPKGALDLILKQDLKLQPHEWTNAVSEWTRRSPDEALTWSKQLSDVKMRGEAVNATLGIIAAKDPQRAITLSTQLLTPQGQDGALARIAAAWADSDPRSAASWAAQLPNQNAQRAAFSNIASRWANEAPTAAAEWLQQMPAGPARDSAVGGFG